MDEASVKRNMLSLRKASGKSQDEVAYLMGISRTAYWNIENGKTEVTVNHIVKFASALEITPEEVILGYVPVQAMEQQMEDPVAKYSTQMQSMVDATGAGLSKVMDSFKEQVNQLEQKIQDIGYVATLNKEEK